MKMTMSGKVAGVIAVLAFGFGRYTPPVSVGEPREPAAPAQSPAAPDDEPSDIQKQSMKQVRELHQACILYAQDNGTYYPDSDSAGKPRFTRQEEIYDVLLAGNFFTPKYMVHPLNHVDVPGDLMTEPREARLAWIAKNAGFIFVTGLKDDNDMKRVAGFEKAQFSDGKRLVLVYEDDGTSLVPLEQAREQIKKQTGKSLEQWSEGVAPKPK